MSLARSDATEEILASCPSILNLDLSPKEHPIFSGVYTLSDDVNLKYTPETIQTQKMASATASSSPSASPSREIDAILTPSRKVKALLAQFDDSDSDRSVLAKNVPAARLHIELTETPSKNVGASPGNQRVPGEDAESDDEAIQQGPRGRLTSRIQANLIQADSGQSEEDSGAKAYARIKDEIAQMSKLKAVASDSVNSGSSEDELQRAAPRRRLLRKKSTTPEDQTPLEATRSPSPLFFPSPSAARPSAKPSSRHRSQQDSDSDELPDDPLNQKGSKFLSLVEKHRKQRLAREAAEETKRAERLEQLKKAGSRAGATVNGLSDESDMSDGNVGKSLTQQARPTRKASKKALEEMSRETQRMSRSMQLAHQAKTKKKITKESLLARFNFITPGSENDPSAKTGHTSTTASSAPASDVEGSKGQNTPPTSPMLSEESKKSVLEAQMPAEPLDTSVVLGDEELPTMEDILATQPTALDKRKAKAVCAEETTEMAKQPLIKTNKPQARPIRVRWSRQDTVLARGADSDSDLEIVTSKSKSKRVAAFENLPQKKSRETKSHLILRSLANLQPASGGKKQASMNAAQMEAHLRRAARLQANKEREEKLEELRSRGILVQTTEERQREQQEIEDLVEKARVEGAEIQRREKEMAKKDGTFVKDQLDDDESGDEEDADFQDEDDEVEDHLSGSEEELQSEVNHADDSGMDDASTKDRAPNLGKGDLIDQEAEETQSEEDNANAEDEIGISSEKENQSPRRPARGRRHLVLSDEDEHEHEHVPHSSLPQVTKTPQSVLRSARKIIPGLQMSDDLPIGLTQAFAATMADSRSEDGETGTQEQDSLALTGDLPSPQFNAIPSLSRLESLDIVRDSQPQTQPLNLDLSLMPIQVVPQSPAGISSTQFSFMPTQDVGYVMSPIKESRFDTPIQAPHSTINTVILPQEEQSPILQRRGRLRRGRATTKSDDETEIGLIGPGLDKSAFAVMQQAAKSVGQQEVFDKAKSHAKEVVDEAAEESEDEYAGLGGASDDNDGVEDEADRKMIDHDEKLGQGDEGKLAGFYA